ncbi:MAG: hypothetical protein D6702_05205 [Planctomycetota bacterium]|nr:MAG: hypothetical protein D6702_05205 [Planctomycetota bacterium]
MPLFATLLTDLPLPDENALRGLLLDCSRTALAGSILQRGMTAVHSFGEADRDPEPREVRVICRKANTAHRAALVELAKQGFRPAAALEFHTDGHPETDQDAWSLCEVYAEEVRGWLVTSYLDFETAAERLGSEDGLLHAPVGGRRKGVLISARALRLLA